MYLIRTPNFIQNLFPSFIWKIETDKKILHLTFDDGPIRQVTPWVLDQLRAFDAKATFFCVGDNVKKYPDVFKQVLAEGHTVGNHTFNHLSGWASENVPYFHNVRHCAYLVNSDLFRPPYGRMKPKQVQFLQRHYKIVMWDVLSGDFDQDLGEDQCLHNVIQFSKEGSIIVFHDSLKAFKNLKYVLPRVLEHFSNLGFSFQALQSQQVQQNLNLKKTA
jgi:peptidoglycan/xylan/chitin deacetylase (PgdA/CDA1 family)